MKKSNPMDSESRMRMNGKAVRWIGTGLVVMCTCLLDPVAAHAAVIFGPVLKGATDTNVYVLVECDSTDPMTVNYGLTSAYGQTATTSFMLSPTTGTNVHRIKLSGLTPDTVYHYQMTGQGTTSPDLTFRTMAKPGTSVRFAWHADWKGGNGVHDQISDRIRTAPGVRFVLEGGDVVDTSSSMTDWHNKYYRAKEVALESQIPTYNTPGNHEGWGVPSKAYFQAPDSSGTDGYYSFDCGDVHVVMCNSYTSIGTSTSNAQYAWMKKDLEASRAAWKIFGTHDPAYTYSVGGHGSDSTMISITSNLLEPNGVKVYLGGHNHFYQHNLVNGIRHLTIGGGGAALYAVGSNTTYTVKSMSTNCYAVCDATPTNLHLVVYDNLGNTLDTIDLFKLPAPATVAAVPGGGGKANVSWAAVPGANDYTVWYGRTDGGPYTNHVVSGTTAAQLAGLGNEPYFFTVTANDTTNGPSALSTQATADLGATYTVSFTGAAHGSLTGSTNQVIVAGNDCTSVTAVPATDYAFDRWSGAVDSTDNPLVVTGVLSNQTVTANFRAKDTDGDGMPDWWERANGFNLEGGDGDGNPDHDLYPNLIEYALGTAAASGAPGGVNRVVYRREADRFEILLPSLRDGANPVPADVALHVGYSSNLVSWVWTLMVPDIVTVGGQTYQRVVPPAGAPAGFYRLRATPVAP